MIYLGLGTAAKLEVVRQYCRDHGIKRVVVLCPPKFRLDLGEEIPHEVVLWGETGIGPRNEIVQYRVYYRLVQEIDHSTLLVVHECLRTQNRNDLTYNCIRQFLMQTHHKLIFQYLPFIDGIEDFMTLFDFDTRSQWKREPFARELVANATVIINPVVPLFQEIKLETTAQQKSAYQKKKAELIDNIGLKDPHTIPRNLYLTTGKTKLVAVEPDTQYVGRNNRFKLPNLTTYRDDLMGDRYTVFEFCHNHLEFNDFLATTRQTIVPVITTDLKVDQWYLQRYRDWADRLNNAIAQIPHTPYRPTLLQEVHDAGSFGEQNEKCVGSGTGAHQLSLRLL
jgi:hypothetical protein